MKYTKTLFLAIFTCTTLVACNTAPNFKARKLSTGEIVDAIALDCHKEGDTVRLMEVRDGLYWQTKENEKYEQYILIEKISKK